MKISFISPTKYIKKFQEQGDFVLALSHLIDRERVNEYEKNITSLNLPIYLDNGAFENGYPEGVDSLLDKAEKIKAEVVIAPDKFNNSKGTYEAIKIFKHIKKERNLKFKTMGVPHAEDMSSYLRLYEELTHDSIVDVIGISLIANRACFAPKTTKRSAYQKVDYSEYRIKALKALLNLPIKHKECHLLGIGDSYRDIVFAKENCPWIRSNDSSSAFVCGYNNIRYKDDLTIPGGKIEKKLDFNINDLTEKQQSNIQYNINFVKKICK